VRYSQKFTVVWLVAAVMALAGCSTTQQPAPSPANTLMQNEAAIRETAQEWGKDIVGKNLDATLSFYADDAWVNPQNASIAKTADERRGVWAAFFATPGLSDMQGNITRVEVARSGDLAVEYGTFSMTIDDKQGKPTPVTEKYIVVWKKQADGRWKAIGDIWNTDK
jgi:ketosteroid isomerase-like protein